MPPTPRSSEPRKSSRHASSSSSLRSPHLPTERRPAMADETVNVRYMVDDVAAAIDFYTSHFGFTVLSSMPPAFADVTRGHLRLLLSGPQSSAGRAMADGARPQ